MPTKKVELINREISWLYFNERVLQEAADKSVPLVERIKFLGIFSNNRDEFFRVRVATLKRMVKLGKKAQAVTGDDPEKVLRKIQSIVLAQQKLFEETYLQILLELESHNVFIINEEQLNKEQGQFVRNYFHQVVRPMLVPIMLDNEGKFPDPKEKVTNLLVKLSQKSKVNKYALLELPSPLIPRILILPGSANKQHLILLDDVIRYCLDEIFYIFEYKSIEAYTFKLTRDAELDIDNDVTKSMVEKLSKSLTKRKKGAAVRLIYDHKMTPDLFDFLLRKMKLTKKDNLIPGGRYHNFKDFMSFPDLGKPELQYTPMPPVPYPELAKGHKSMFDILRKKDMLLTFPYQSFSHIIDLLREAAIDPKVSSIKIALYRVANNSNIINTLINAAKNGKSVTVVMELQARFDEKANLYWASKLQEENVKVIFGVPGLKVHAKIFLITRKNGRQTEHFGHIGTGNFNERTALIYSDHSLLTADKRITAELQKVFTFFHNNLKASSFNHLLVSPFYMRKRLMKLINNEIKNAKDGRFASIHLKMNNFSDPEFISKLYEASKAGVKIKMIVRGICSLIPGIKGMSENIEAISIVDRFLEHSRIFVFANNGDELYYLSSADWMARNLDFRIEVATPVYDKDIQKSIKCFLDLQFKGNVKARIIDGTRKNSYRKISADKPFRAQYAIYEHFKNKLKK
jgi:polyphosphate kinase